MSTDIYCYCWSFRFVRQVIGFYFYRPNLEMEIIFNGLTCESHQLLLRVPCNHCLNLDADGDWEIIKSKRMERVALHKCNCSITVISGGVCLITVSFKIMSSLLPTRTGGLLNLLTLLEWVKVDNERVYFCGKTGLVLRCLIKRHPIKKTSLFLLVIGISILILVHLLKNYRSFCVIKRDLQHSCSKRTRGPLQFFQCSG